MQRMMMAAKAQTVASDQEVNDGLAEIELQKLQRQYRIMEGDRKAYSEESRIVISKQRASIDKLKRDNLTLLNELRLLETRNEDRKRNGIQSKKAELMSDQAESFQRKIRQILTEIAALDDEIANVDRDIDQFRAELGGVNAGMQNSDAIEKQIRVLENRLDKALVKFNKSLAVNKRLRATIDNLRRERLVFDNIYRKFERELMEQKKQMAEIIEMSNAAYEARDEAQARIIALREKAEKEHQAYVQEMKELDRALEQDRRLKEFMATKAADRLDNVDGIHKKPRHDKETFANKFPSQDALTDSLETYEKAFYEIRKVTGTNDIGELVQRFKAVEDQNFSLFNYVNEVNNEIEKVAEEIIAIQTQIDALRVANVAAEEERMRIIAKLEVGVKTNGRESLGLSKEKASVYESQYQQTTVLLEDLRKGIDKVMQLFRKTELPTAATSKPKSPNPPGAAAAAGAVSSSSPSSSTDAKPPGGDADLQRGDGKADGVGGEGGVGADSDDASEAVDGEQDPAGTEAFGSGGSGAAGGEVDGEDDSRAGAAGTADDGSGGGARERPEFAAGGAGGGGAAGGAESVGTGTSELAGDGAYDEDFEKPPSILAAATEALVGAHGVTDANILACLGLIEHGTNEFLTLHYTVNPPKKSGTSASSSEDKGDGVKEVLVPTGGVGNLLGQGPMVPIASLTITPPSTGDDHESDDNISDEDDRPLTREELRQKSMKGVGLGTVLLFLPPIIPEV
ncbi:hypothetical protein DFJ73DRAFT_758787 [Zopfochytrium polystomum]|nr:hypothetical protein DFJ73DRAFT_758787 [Zopfochytrium polystomum]